MSAGCIGSNRSCSSFRCCLWTISSTRSWRGPSCRCTSSSTSLCRASRVCTSARRSSKSSVSVSWASSLMVQCRKWTAILSPAEGQDSDKITPKSGQSGNISRHVGTGHAAENDPCFAPQTRRPAVAVIEARIGHHAGQPCRLFRPELGGAGVEIMARRRIGAKNAVPPLDHVQIDLENPPFAPQILQHQRDDRLLDLAEIRLVWRQEQVFRQLLADGRTAGHETPLLLIFFQRFLHAFPVEAFMIDELGIFGSDDRPLQVDRNPLVRHPLLLQLGIRHLLAQFSQADFHESGFTGIEPTPEQHPTEQPQLPEQKQAEQGQQGPLQPMTDDSHPASLARSSASTGAVAGRTPRQTKKASAACSTSIPSPSAPRAAPCSRACRRKGVSPLPYIMS